MVGHATVDVRKIDTLRNLDDVGNVSDRDIRLFRLPSILNPPLSAAKQLYKLLL